MMKRLLLLLSVFILFFGITKVYAETLTVSDSLGEPGQTVTLTITLGNNVTGVAGAAFTLNHGSDLTLSDVRSDFFPLFSAQGITPSTVTVDSVVYDKALVFNPTASMIAAAKAEVTPPTGDEILFEVDFLISGGATADQTIQIVPSNISNTSAGYPAGGEDIAMLIGISGSTYPEITVTNTPAQGEGTIFMDTDSDNMADSWELANAPPGSDLTYFEEGEDRDGDGYTDDQEYANFINGELDPADAAYDPDSVNEPGGTGYNPPTSGAGAMPAVYFLLLGE